MRKIDDPVLGLIVGASVLLSAASAHAGCKMFLGAGQSNLTGQGPLIQGLKYAGGNPQQCFTSDGVNVTFKPLADPLQEIWTQPVQSTGSMLPAFANSYYWATGDQVIYCGGAVNGQGLLKQTPPGHSWTGINSAGNYNLTQLVNKALGAQATLAQQGLSCPIVGVIWVGGERDARYAFTAPAIAPGQWQDGFLQFEADTRAALGLPNLAFFVVSLDNWSTYSNGFAFIRQEQKDAVAAGAFTYMAVPYQGLEAKGGLIPANLPHWNQPVQNFIGASLAVNTAAAIGNGAAIKILREGQPAPQPRKRDGGN